MGLVVSLSFEIGKSCLICHNCELVCEESEGEEIYGHETYPQVSALVAFQRLSWSKNTLSSRLRTARSPLGYSGAAMR